MIEVTKEIAIKVRDIVDAGLVAGLGMPIPGQMCVEAAICKAFGLQHGDNPPGVAASVRNAKIILNDANWSNHATRAKGMRKLALLQLDTAETLDEMEFARRLVMFTINRILPRAMRAAGLENEAAVCERAADLKAAAWAADAAEKEAWAAAGAAGAAAWAAGAAGAVEEAAAWAAGAAARAAVWAAWAAGAAGAVDAALQFFADGMADILIDMNVPGIQWMGILGDAA